MKITHIALCGPVTDNLTYQDNLLPKYHKELGLDVSMITSKYIWDKGKIKIDDREVYYNEYGIKTIRLKNRFNTSIQSKFKKYQELYEIINNENPDILFVHGVQFLDIKKIIKYIKENPEITLYVDNHADFSNSATNWISKNILHKVIWKKMAKMVEPYVTKFYGVIPARVDFLKEIYDLPNEKIELLVLGADDQLVESASTKESIIEVKKRLNINNDDFIIVTGGKIDKAKIQVLNLMRAVATLNDSKVKLIVYGSVVPEMQKQVNNLAKNESIEYIGWINDAQSYELFSVADLVVFPGRHSVYWEQVVAMGVPMIVKYWEGTTHIDISGNCEFLYEDSEKEMYKTLKKIIYNESIYKNMLRNAQSDRKNKFLYSKIAEDSIKKS